MTMQTTDPTRELATHEAAPTLAMERAAAFAPRSFSDVMTMAAVAQKSGLARCDTAEQAAIIIMTGIELGYTPMQALRAIYSVEGRPFVSADGLKALVFQSGLCESWECTEKTADKCTIRTKRRGFPEIVRSFTHEDAERAGLLKDKGGHSKYPAIMLEHRCTAVVAREAYPEVVLGMYVPEERGEIEGHAEVIETRIVQPRQAEAVPAPAVDWPAKIAACTELPDLMALGPVLKDATKAMPAADKKRLADAYQTRKAELQAKPAEPAREPGDEG